MIDCVQNEDRLVSVCLAVEWAAWGGTEYLSWGSPGETAPPPTQNGAEGVPMLGGSVDETGAGVPSS